MSGALTTELSPPLEEEEEEEEEERKNSELGKHPQANSPEGEDLSLIRGGTVLP